VSNDNRKLQHANGDTATVTEWTNGLVTVHWDVDVGESAAKTVWAIHEFVDYFKLAYAITIHKSQGSEYDAGVVVLSPKCRWFAQRSSLYTAITRFKSECAIFALDVDLDAAINAPMHLPIIGNMATRLQAAEARNADDGRHDCTDD
jgi:exodeoxyribonuclease V alpha subunit